jgi:hypothetical protein
MPPMRLPAAQHFSMICRLPNENARPHLECHIHAFTALARLPGFSAKALS